MRYGRSTGATTHRALRRSQFDPLLAIVCAFVARSVDALLAWPEWRRPRYLWAEASADRLAAQPSHSSAFPRAARRPRRLGLSALRAFSDAVLDQYQPPY